MSTVLPGGFLFRYRLTAPRLDSRLSSDDLPPLLDHVTPIPDFSALSDDRSSSNSTFSSWSDLRVAWHETGLAVQLDVTGKSRPVRCQSDSPDSSDGLTLLVDTRNTQTIHRASRFCHAFALLPSGGGRRHDQPVATQRTIARAREEAPAAPAKSLLISSTLTTDGYRLSAWMAAPALHGWDPDTMDAIGFAFRVHDGELGDRSSGGGGEFPFERDPSLWSVLALDR